MKIDIISSGDKILDQLLEGGFHKNLIYMLYGDEKETTQKLLNIAVIAQKPFSQDLDFKVVFINGNDLFDPNYVSKYAVSQQLMPRTILENILVARVYSWDALVELIENRLSNLEKVKVILISGIQIYFQHHIFEEMLNGINRIKKILSKTKPLLVINAHFDENSPFSPERLEDKSLISQLGIVIVLINENERSVEYVRVHHPFQLENRLVRWKKPYEQFNS